MLYKLIVRVEREDGYNQECFTHHDPDIVKNEEAFMLAAYNNSTQLWNEMEIPTSRELELEQKLHNKERLARIVWGFFVGAMLVSLILIFALAGS